MRHEAARFRQMSRFLRPSAERLYFPGFHAFRLLTAPPLAPTLRRATVRVPGHSDRGEPVMLTPRLRVRDGLPVSGLDPEFLGRVPLGPGHVLVPVVRLARPVVERAEEEDEH